jgi:hypothetical protein
MTDPLRNPRDPLHGATPPGGRELMRALAPTLHGVPNDVVLDVAVNLIINVLRQQNPTWAKAEVAWDELFGRGKTILHQHYDASGRKRGVFPYDQVVTMPLFELGKNIK